MMSTDDIIKLINKNKRPFEDEDFDTFFSRIPNNQKADVAQFLIGKVGIPVLYKMTSIPEFFLYKTTLVTSLTIPANIEEVQKKAFSFSALSKVTFEDGGVKTLGNQLFEGSALEDIILPDGLVAIPKECFKDCSKLKRVIMPLSVCQIGTGAFSGCPESMVIITPKGKRNTKKGALQVCQADIPFLKKVVRAQNGTE